MQNEQLNTPTAAENLTEALQRLAHKKMVLLILTTIYLANAHPGYLLANSLIGTVAILISDYFNRSSERKKYEPPADLMGSAEKHYETQ